MLKEPKGYSGGQKCVGLVDGAQGWSAMEGDGNEKRKKRIGVSDVGNEKRNKRVEVLSISILILILILLLLLFCFEFVLVWF